jgi:hypothetical protein
MRRAIRAEEKARIARRRRLNQRHAMRLALEHRQTVVMRTQAALEDRVAVVQQVVRGDRRGSPVRRASLADVLRGVFRRDVLEHHLQLGQVAAQRLEHAVDEHGLAVEQVESTDPSPRRAPAA